MTDLVARIEAAADALTDRVLSEMYADPFWYERYGERAEKHGRQDGHFHIKYLGEALRGNEPAVMEHYARWLQQLLTTRGMCTRHLDENFARLAHAIADTIADSAPAVAMLEAGRKALRYADGPARQVQELRGHDATDVSYAADAVALKQPDVFAKYVAWTGDFLARRGDDRAAFDARIAALRDAVQRELGPGLL